jgi:hypothetical protein
MVCLILFSCIYSQDGSDDDDWVNGSRHISTNGNGHANGISH